MTENGTITKEQAQEVLQQSLQKDAQAFLQAYSALCEEHQAYLVPTAGLSQDGRIVANIAHLSIRGQMVEIRK